MKKVILGFLAITLIVFSSCKKETNGLIQQSHDANIMMDSMHVMMDEMAAMTMSMDPDVDFAQMMIMHHEGAIRMAKIVVASGSNATMKTFAQKVITDQTAEISALKAILSTITVDNMDMDYMAEQEANLKKMSASADAQVITGNIDSDFATLMIVHHQAATDDAYGYLHHGNVASLKTIANNIVATQSTEITDLSNWLKANRK